MKTYYCSRCGSEFESAECERPDDRMQLGLGLKCPVCGGPGRASGAALVVMGLTTAFFSNIILGKLPALCGTILSGALVGLGIFRLVQQRRCWDRVGRAMPAAEVKRDDRISHREQPDAGKAPDARTAAEVLFLLEQLQTLDTAQPEYAWLWRIRSKVLHFFVENYDLRSRAEGHRLSDDEKRRIVETEGLLQPPESVTPDFESREVAKVREHLRRKLSCMQAFGGRA